MKTSKIGIALFEGTKEKPGRNYVPYGMFANIQEGIMTGVFLDQGNEESLFFLPFDVENAEVLGKNEIGFGIPSGKDRIYFRDGKITFKIGDTEGGDFAVKHTQLNTGIQQMATDINAELVKIAAAINAIVPGSYTPTPIVPDISSSKVEKIELPS